jgi:uncharacterized protein (TIGR03435 family)
MNLFLFLVEWLVRSSVLILAGAIVLWLLRVKSPSARLAAWTFLLGASLAVPLLRSALPQLPLTVRRTAAPVAAAAVSPTEPALATSDDSASAALTPRMVAEPFDWMGFAVLWYTLVAALLLARLLIGLALSFSVIRRSRATGIASNGVQARESDGVLSPVTAGVFWPVILLPTDWRDWPSAKLAAVLAHECSHMRRRDSGVQFLSAIHRSLLWASPASWILDRGLVRAAEELSDDDAISAIGDRILYAELLLEFSQRASGQSNWVMVPMARQQRPEKRIRRVLNSNAIPRRLTRWSVTVTLALGAPLTYLAAAVHPQGVPQPAPTPIAVGPEPAPAQAEPAAAARIVSQAAPGPVQAAPTAAPSPGKPLTFDAASVKPVKPPPSGGGRGKAGGGPGGPGTSDPSRIHYPAIRLKDLILRAYDLKDYQIVGPDWLNATDESTRFAVDATMPPDTSLDQFRAMLRNLLAERFKLTAHHETREMPVYALVVAKGGLKIKESAPAPPAGSGAAELPPGGRNSGKFDPYGFPVRNLPPEGGIGSWFINGRCQLFGVRRTIQELADGLVMHLSNTPVTNDTGLTGTYDFTLTYSRPRFEGTPLEGVPVEDWVMNPPEGPAPLGDIFESIQTELGLKLEAKKGPRDVIVIDHIEKKPTEN